MQKIIGHVQYSILPKIDVSKGLRTQYVINCDITLQVSTETIKRGDYTIFPETFSFFFVAVITFFPFLLCK